MEEIWAGEEHVSDLVLPDDSRILLCTRCRKERVRQGYSYYQSPPDWDPDTPVNSKDFLP